MEEVSGLRENKLQTREEPPNGWHSVVQPSFKKAMGSVGNITVVNLVAMIQTGG